MIFIIIIVMLMISAFFSLSETSTTGISEARIHKMATDGSKQAQLVERLIQKKELLIGSILIAHNSIHITGSVLVSYLAARQFTEIGVIVITTFMTIAIIVFGELLPKSYAINHTEKVALFISYPLKIAVSILQPLTDVILALTNILARIFGAKNYSNQPIISVYEELKGSIDFHHTKGEVAKYQKDMIGSVLELDDTEVSEIMVHRRNIFSIDIAVNAQVNLDRILQSGHTRIPVWQTNPENIIGILNVKDILKALNLTNGNIEKTNLLDFCVAPWFIPENTNLKEQIDAFRLRRNPFAIVVDEYGDIQGLVTLKDILEEIVGHTEDEHTRKNNNITFGDDGSAIIKGLTSIKDFNRKFDLNISDEHASTIAGLIIHYAEKLPDIGEEFEINNLKFSVLERKDNQITSVRVVLPREDEDCLK